MSSSDSPLIVKAPLDQSTQGYQVVRILVSRRSIVKRLWRATAEDGMEFGFEVESPLHNGALVHLQADKAYVLAQTEEPVLELPLDIHSDAAILLGWTIGNLHTPLQVTSHAAFIADEPGLSQALDRLGVHYHRSNAVFEPHRSQVSFHGHGHSHGSGHAHTH